ncbi:MAG: Sua5/YciO/YrdC/YwlC family protein, partial [Thermoanaerobaculia bacterium]|nr:Sua5/YciO/YrdC/YwlC family protein [Thermoanaerobaculia bacterium]
MLAGGCRVASAAPPVSRLRALAADLAVDLPLVALALAVRARSLLEPCDDAFILLAVARNALTGFGPHLDPGSADAVLSTFLWPLHHLLLRAVGLPLVATSGNLSEEPIAIDDAEAVERLAGIADLFLGHDRPITRHVDDSVARRFEGSVQVLRRARGYAPLPVLLRDEGPTVLAVGAHQKDVVALARGRQVFLSQHIGDLETPQARAAMERVALDFVRLFAAPPAAVAHDLHPDYPSTRWALAAAAPGGRLARAVDSPSGLAACAVQHHHAHLAAVLAEHGVEGPALGVTWDGTGYGPDGTVWGGELLLGDAAGFERVARLRPFGLPGGEAAVRQPWRVALALLHPIDGALEAGVKSCDPLSAVTPAERRFVLQLLDRHARTPDTSSAGRLFDGVAALLGLCLRASWEGEAAVALEALAGDADPWPLPPFEIVERAAPPPARRRSAASRARAVRGAQPRRCQPPRRR